MKTQISRQPVRRLLTFALATCFSSQVMAQAPSSLSYPTPSVFTANVSAVFLSPNLSGNATAYTINPSLPAGLSFNTNNGVISGVPTAASATTDYTITAIGSIPSETTTTTIGIQVTNNFFDNVYAPISFGGNGSSLMNGSTGAVISNSTTNTHGRSAGEIVVYRDVANLGGQAIDCIVKTVSLTTGTTWSAYDQNDVSGNNNAFSNNDPKYFSPQVTFPNGSSNNAPGGSIVFNFQFILGGTYSTVTKTGIPVVLQNVKINTYDIDGNGANFSNQTNEFGGFSTSEVGNPTGLQPATYNATTDLTTYRSGTTANTTSVTAQTTRVRLTYNNMSNFNIRVGGGGSAYFFLDFSTGGGFSTAVTSTAPSIDLNTDVIGINNAGSGCGTTLPFTIPSQTNITASGDLTQLKVSFPTGDILNSGEELVVTGASNGTIALNTDPSINNLNLGGIVYSVTGTTANNVRTLVFSRNTGAFTVSNAEDLLDALTYQNTNATPTAGNRNFTVNVRNAAFQSPNAIFTATLNCVAISGHVYHDVNGQVDNTVNATGTSGQFTAGDVRVVRVDPITNLVIDVKDIQNGGAFSFGTVTPGAYALYVTTDNPAPGTLFQTASYPANYVPTAEHLGADTGTDKATDGKLLLTIGSTSISDANFGLQVPPTTDNSSITGIPNPGGFNNYNLQPNTFVVNDADGKTDSIVINSFPTGINYLKIGNVVYTSGGTCPPQVESCTPWPGTVVVPFINGNPAEAISVDPILEGNTSSVINFTSWDDARMTGNSSNVNLEFIGTTYYDVSGNVWHDFNGNGNQDGTETLTNIAAPGQTLYALLVQQNNTYSSEPTILASSVVDATNGYSFTNVPENNDYTIRIVSLATAPVDGIAASDVTPHFAAGWTGVSTNADGNITTNLNTNNPGINIGSLNGNKSNLNFGIEEIPYAADVTALNPVANPGGSTAVPVVILEGSDPEDMSDTASLSGKIVTIVSLPVNGTLIYNGTAVTPGQVINSYDPALLTIDPNDNISTLTFTYTYTDIAGVNSNTAVATMNFADLVISGNVYIDGNGLTDQLVNATPGVSTGSVITQAGNLYASLLEDGSTIATATIDDNGYYAFANVTPGTYSIVIHTTPGGSTTAQLPADWLHTGDQTGTTANTGIDDDANGVQEIVVTGSSIDNVNFGIERKPIADGALAVPQVNPGGTNTVQVPALDGSDAEDGAYTGNHTIIITSLPATGTGILYYDGTPVTAGDIIANYDPTKLTVDPGTGAQTVTFTYKVVDAAHIPSDNANVSLSFTALDIAGNIFDDANGLQGIPVNTVDGTGTDAGGLNIFLIGSDNKVITSTTVAVDGTYSFSNIDAGTYQLIISTVSAADGSSAPTVILPNQWVVTGENLGAGAGNDGSEDGMLAVTLTASSLTDANFGIDQLPEALDATTHVPQPALNTLFTLDNGAGNPPVPSANDPEDGALAAGGTIVITSLPVYTTLLYNNTEVVLGQVINNFDPSLLQILVTLNTVGQSGTSFTFNYQDNAGKQDVTPATYALTWDTPLPVKMGTFSVRKEDGKAKLNWVTYSEEHNKGFGIERSTDSRNWKQTDFVPSAAVDGNSSEKLEYVAYDTHPLSGINYYRLQQIDFDGHTTYSEVKQVVFGQDNNTISIYPNPATSIVNIDVTDWSKIIEVRLVDINGKVVYQTKDAQNGVPLQNLAQGTYLLQVEQSNSETTSFKILKH